MDVEKLMKSRRIPYRRFVPQWFQDLDAGHKPLVIVAALVMIVLPAWVLLLKQASNFVEAQNQLNNLLNAGTVEREAVAAAAADAHSAADRLRWIMGLMTLYQLGVAVGGAYVSSAMTAEWLVNLVKFTGEVGTGDLTRVIERDNASQVGDIQEALGKMIASFRTTITRIEQAAVDLKEAAGEMAHTSDEAGNAIGEVAQAISSISEGAAHQVDLVTRTSEVVADIEQAVRNTYEHASQAQQESAQTEQLTEAGVQRATEVQEAMQSVRETSLSTADVVRSLGEKSSDIDQIVQAITDIAAQTNLLALNAAIEAARAGEQGRGFAVVAEEVRKLAEDAQASAGDIAALIKEIQVQTTQAVDAMEEGVNRVETGFETVNRNRQTFFDISGAVRALHESSAEISGLAEHISRDASRVREQIEEVASVAEESSASTEQVSASTEQTSAAAEEVTASAQRVSHTALTLAELAGRFKVHDGRGNGSAAEEQLP